MTALIEREDFKIHHINGSYARCRRNDIVSPKKKRQKKKNQCELKGAPNHRWRILAVIPI